jgi:hypothetical protein
MLPWRIIFAAMRRLAVLPLLLALTAPIARAQVRARSGVIRQKMMALAPLVGTWTATTVFHRRDGRMPEDGEIGTYEIGWTLDSTYLAWHITLHDKDNAADTRYMLIMMTYNPDSLRYEENYFYNGSSLKVFESGDYDARRRELRTTAFIPLEDGMRDEHVRTITAIRPNGDVVYTHYSRYNDEAVEHNDFSARLHRLGRAPG